MKRIAIMASGNGSNAEALIKKAQVLREHCNCVAVISDKENPGVKLRAQTLNTEFYSLPIKTNKVEQEKELLVLLNELQIDWLFLAGYMRILSANFLQNFSRNAFSPVINIHPSLLPKYRGKDAYEQAFASGDSFSGISVHFVDDGVDTGPIIAQEEFPRLKSDSLEDFKQRGLAVEHRLYPQVLEDIIFDRLKIPEKKSR